MNDNLNIETLANWSAPQQHGEVFIRFAKPGSAFWDAWKSQKEALRQLDVSISKDAGVWVAKWIVSAESAAAVAPAAEAAPSFSWSPEQEAIFAWARNGKGNRVVQARAGSGKTTTIKKMFEFCPEDRMLYAVFNSKNCKEAQEKITDLRVTVHSLHSLGYFFIRQVWNSVRANNFVEGDRLEACAGGPLSDDVFSSAKKLLSLAKNRYVSPSVGELVELAQDFDIEDCQGYPLAKLASLVIKAMEFSKTRDPQNRISFDDMVWLPMAMGWVKPLFPLVVIDEAQDMNWLQLMMAMEACKKGGRIMIVGDDRQCIYSFRGAVPDGMKRMQEILNAEVMGLTVTRRCPKLVVDLVKSIVPDFTAAPDAPVGLLEEATCGGLLSLTKVGDAVLSRLNAPLMPLCLKLLKAGVAARIEGRDIGATLAGLVKKLNAKSIPNFIEKLNGWGDRQIARALKAKHDVDAKVEAIKDQVACLEAIAEGCNGIPELYIRIENMFQDSDANPRPAVVFSSVHKAKGLEWQNVFVLQYTLNCKFGDPREEENIKYVAYTRTKNRLVRVSN